MTLKNKKILIIIGGGIAAYKSLDLIRLLKKNGNEVKRLNFEKLIHGFVNLTNIRKADVATIKIFETMKGYLN